MPQTRFNAEGALKTISRVRVRLENAWKEIARGRAKLGSGIFETIFSGNARPVVSIVSPAPSDLIVRDAAFVIEADAIDPDDNLVRTDFLVKGPSDSGFGLIGSDSGGDPSTPYTPTELGRYSVKAVALDEDGSSSESVVEISVVEAANEKPNLSLTRPTSSQTIHSGNKVRIEAVATDPDGSVSNVEFFINGAAIGKDFTAASGGVYAKTWNAEAGAHTVSAVATDNEGTPSVQEEVNINVNDRPSVQITAPDGNTIFTEGDAVTVSADFSDSDGTVEKATFFVNGQQEAQKTPGSASGTVSFDWSAIVGKPVTLEVQVDDDQGGTRSAATNVVVEGVNKAPTLSWVSPSAGDEIEVGQPITLKVSASDPDGAISDVRIGNAASGIYGEANLNNGLYETEWTPQERGPFTFIALATDDEGARTTQLLSVNVAEREDPTGSMGATGSVEYIQPGKTLAINLVANDTGGSGLDKVEFLVEGSVEDTQQADPGQQAFVFDFSRGSTGNYDLKAKLYDKDGNTATIDGPRIYVRTSEVGATSPTGVVTEGETFEAVARTRTNRLTNEVKFYVDGEYKGKDRSPNSQRDRWELGIDAGSPGSYTLEVRSFDHQGFEIDRGTLQFDVESAADGTKPAVSLDNPLEGDVIELGTTTTVFGSALDSESGIRSIRIRWAERPEGQQYPDWNTLANRTNDPQPDGSYPENDSISGEVAFPAGEIWLKVDAENGEGLSDNNASYGESIQVKDTTPPEISSNSDRWEGQTYGVGDELGLQVSASDSNGSGVQKIEAILRGDGEQSTFTNYADGAQFRIDLPYPGTNTIEAIATDRAGNEISTGEYEFTVEEGPKINSIDDISIAEGESDEFVVSGTYTNSSIELMLVQTQNQEIAEANLPFNLSGGNGEWSTHFKIPSTLPSHTYSLGLRITDGHGNSDTSLFSIEVSPSYGEPVVKIAPTEDGIQYVTEGDSIEEVVHANTDTGQLRVQKAEIPDNIIVSEEINYQLGQEESSEYGYTGKCNMAIYGYSGDADGSLKRLQLQIGDRAGNSIEYGWNVYVNRKPFFSAFEGDIYNGKLTSLNGGRVVGYVVFDDPDDQAGFTDDAGIITQMNHDQPSNSAISISEVDGDGSKKKFKVVLDPGQYAGSFDEVIDFWVEDGGGAESDKKSLEIIHSTFDDPNPDPSDSTIIDPSENDPNPSR